MASRSILKTLTKPSERTAINIISTSFTASASLPEYMGVTVSGRGFFSLG